MLALCVLALILTAAPGLADDFLTFQSPSGNIQCGIFLGPGALVRCDMTELAPSFTQRPVGCEFDWGHSFAVEETSEQGYLACVSDAVTDGNAMVLGYGRSVSLGPFTCASEKTGMTCTNAQGHGFAIARAAQRFF